MSVYVDDMFKYPMGQFRRMKMSHMMADTEGELHAMARELGLQRRWFQGDHYDVALGLRTKAIALGAVEITLKEMAKRAYVLRTQGYWPTPEQARAVWERLNLDAAELGVSNP